MGRIRYMPQTEQYRELREKSSEMNEKGDCAVVAVAAVCGVTYERAHARMSEQGRRNRTGSHTSQIEAAVRSLGFTTSSIPPYMFIERYPGVHATALRNVTTHHPDRFPQVWKDGNTYLFYTRHHVGAVVDGVNVDWTRGTAKRVYRIVRVESIL